MNYCKGGSFFKIPNKSWELQITTDFNVPWFNFQCQWTRNQDHAGFQFVVEMYKFMFDFRIHDNRHWDFDNDCYEEQENG